MNLKSNNKSFPRGKMFENRLAYELPHQIQQVSDTERKERNGVCSMLTLNLVFLFYMISPKRSVRKTNVCAYHYLRIAPGYLNGQGIAATLISKVPKYLSRDIRKFQNCYKSLYRIMDGQKNFYLTHPNLAISADDLTLHPAIGIEADSLTPLGSKLLL